MTCGKPSCESDCRKCSPRVSQRGRRAKGHAFERQVAADLRDIFGPEVKRGLQSRGGGKEQADVVCPLVHIECKRGSKPNPRAALAQAVADSEGSGKVPIAVIRDDRAEAFAVVRWVDMLELLRAVRDSRIQNVERADGLASWYERGGT